MDLHISMREKQKETDPRITNPASLSMQSPNEAGQMMPSAVLQT